MAKSDLIEMSPADKGLVALWVTGRPENTALVYRRAAALFLAHARTPLQLATLEDIRSYLAAHPNWSSATLALNITVLRCLFSFGHEVGYLATNPACRLKNPKIVRVATPRPLTEEQVHLLLAATSSPRDHALLRTLYIGGFRQSEASGLRWKDFTPTEGGCYASVVGKRNKLRQVFLTESLWEELKCLRQNADDNQLVFRTRCRAGKPISNVHIARMFRAAALKCGIDTRVSPHSFRWAHASHAVARGADIHVVQKALGHVEARNTALYIYPKDGDRSSSFPDTRIGEMHP